MAGRAVAFDIIGTVFSLETQRPLLVAAGLPAHALERWIAGTLRDLFGLGAIGRLVAMRDLLEANLLALLDEAGAVPDRDRVEAVLAGMSMLDPKPGAEAALLRLRDAGTRVLALSNGSRAATEGLLRRAGLEGLFEAVLSIDEVGLPKPCRAVYHSGAERMAVRPDELTLVASHPWDIQGAIAAGLGTIYVPGPVYPACLDRPGAVAADLVAAARSIAG